MEVIPIPFRKKSCRRYLAGPAGNSFWTKSTKESRFDWQSTRLKNIMWPCMPAGIIRRSSKWIGQKFLRNDIHISRQVMANWMIQCADRYLGPLYDYLHNRMYRFYVLQVDETPVKVSKDGRPTNRKSCMWVYRTGKGYGDTPIILYEYQKTRKADHPREFLKGFTGVVVRDGYSAY